MTLQTHTLSFIFRFHPNSLFDRNTKRKLLAPLFIEFLNNSCQLESVQFLLFESRSSFFTQRDKPNLHAKSSLFKFMIHYKQSTFYLQDNNFWSPTSKNQLLHILIIFHELIVYVNKSDFKCWVVFYASFFIDNYFLLECWDLLPS